MIEARFDSSEVHALVKDLRKIEGGKLITKELRKELKAAAAPIAAQVKANASWSKRIPRAVSVGTSFTARRTGVFIRVNAKKAPHARPLENRGKTGNFRHPVFGDRKRWVSQPARPFLFSAAGRNMPQVEQAAVRAVDRAARAAGFR